MVCIGQIRCHEIISQTSDSFVCAWKASFLATCLYWSLTRLHLIGLSVFCTRKAQRRAQAFPITPRAPFGHDFSRSVPRVRFPSPNKGDYKRVSFGAIRRWSNQTWNTVARRDSISRSLFTHTLSITTLLISTEAHVLNLRYARGMHPRYIIRAIAAMDQWTVKSVHQRPFI